MNTFARRATAWSFNRVCAREASPLREEDYFEAQFEAGFGSAERFFARLPADVRDLRGKTVLDLGCGSGATCVWAAQRGARRVVGADIQSVELMRRKLASDYPELAGVVELSQITDGSELDGELFDVVLSKNTFEHVGDPESYVDVMQAHVAPGGHVVIGFSPLWKSPLGGHIGFMTKFPWAHLLFPEDVIMAERKRFRPNEDAQRFEQIRGGLNRMTLAKFEQVMAASGLKTSYFEVNAGAQARSWLRVWALRVMRLLGRIPGLREYFAFSVHGVWEPGSARRAHARRFEPDPARETEPAQGATQPRMPIA